MTASVSYRVDRLDIDAITNIKAWNAIWDNVYYNNKGEKVILSVSYEDDQFDFTEYNKYSNKDGDAILKRIQECYGYQFCVKM